MKRLLTAILGIAALATIVVSPVGAEQSYTDPNGDAGPGTDITAITVRNDQAGLISIQVASASPIVGNHAVAVFIDADKNQSTGDDGIEAWMFGGPLVGSAFFTCSSAGCSETNPANFAAGEVAANITEFRFSRGDIGNSAGFDFAVVSISIDPPNLNFWDAAPNSGTYAYDLVFPQCSNGSDDDGDGKVDADDLGCSSPTDENEADDPVTLQAGKATVKPAKPRAGRRVVVSAPITRVETNSAVTSGAVRCEMKAAGKTSRTKGSFARGRATCRLVVPRGAAKKLARGKITVTHLGKTVIVPFSFRTA